MIPSWFAEAYAVAVIIDAAAYGLLGLLALRRLIRRRSATA